MAVIMALAALGFGFSIKDAGDKANLYWPLLVMYVFQFTVFVLTLSRETILRRHVLAASYVLVILIGTRSLLFHYNYTGRILDESAC